MTMINKTNLPTSPQVLDPRLLGRPVHLLPQFSAQFAEDVAGALRQPAVRRYWDGFQLEAAGFVGAPDAARSGRWLAFEGPAGNVAFALERSLLLAVLNQRYGRRGAAPAPAVDPATVRVTATEERLAVVLGQQLASVLARRVDANLARAHNEAGAPSAELVPGSVPPPPPAAGGWTLGLTLRRALGGECGQLWLALDQEMMARVLQGITPERARERAPQASVALGTALHVNLDGRLVSKEITLEALFALKLGDIIPVTVGRADVLLAESRLFTAAVTEHNGTLCLTSFEDSD
jgi:flagellar motor switch protein FliM